MLLHFIKEVDVLEDMVIKELKKTMDCLIVRQRKMTQALSA